MEINKVNRSALNTYKSVLANKPSDKNEGNKPSAAGKTDTVDFDFDWAVIAAKASVASKIDADVNAAKIKELQESYEGGNCPVGAVEIAAAIAGYTGVMNG